MPEDEKKKAVAREDKVALLVLSLLSAFIVVAILYAIKVILQMFGVVLDTAADGIGFKSAFVASVGLSFIFMLIFALFAGDGVIGELGVMLIGFFVMIAFFTVSIALIL